VKASDIANAISAMEMANEYITANVEPFKSGRSAITHRLYCATLDLKVRLAGIDIKIEADK
jgi:hypothetical protein